MRAVTKHRTERLRANVPGPAEILRLAAWYDGIANDYAEANADAEIIDRVKRAACERGERDARQMARQLRAKVADR